MRNNRRNSLEGWGVEMDRSILLVEADLFISYLTGDEFEPASSKLVSDAEEGKVDLVASSEVYDDVATALRSQSISSEEAANFVDDMKKIPHKSLPVTADIAANALRLYAKQGGSRKLHYFDAFHIATARYHNLSLVTSDVYIIQNAKKMEIVAMDIRRIGQK